MCQAGPRAPKASPGQDLRGRAAKQAEQRCEYGLTNCATRGISEARASPWLWRKLVKLQRTSVILSHLIPISPAVRILLVEETGLEKEEAMP